MLKAFSIKALLLVSFAIILILVTAINIPVVLTSISGVVEQAEQRELHGLFKSAQTELEAEGYLAKALASMVANIDLFTEMFANKDRDALAKSLVPAFKVMKKEYNARQFQFHTPPATSFLRVHKPQKFGDDLSSFRKTVVETNRSKKKIRGLEKGVAGLGVRGITPVFHQGRHIGSVEFGMSFGQPFFEQFKKKHNVDISLYIKQDGSFKKFGSTREGDRLFTDEQLLPAMKNKPVIGQISTDTQELAVYAHRVNDFSGNPVGVLEIAMDRSHYAAAISNSRNIVISIGVGSLIVGFLFAGFIARQIGKPLCQTVDALNEISHGEGDLTLRLDEAGKNEISKLAAAFNRFAEKVRLLVSQVSGSTVQLASAAEEMSLVTDETTQGVMQQQSETSLVATAMNEMTATVQEVARHATEAAEAATHADHSSAEGKQIVSNTMSTIENLSGNVHSAANVISQLEQDSESIGTVLDVIKSIAEQTNLLALNAAIEAARAGEQGRGFAVVADEVRTLASRTQQSTQEIQEMIEKLQTGARSAVKVMEDSRSIADESVNQAALAGSSLEQITSAVSRIKDMNTQIATAAEEQSSVAEEINKNVVNISDVVDQTAEGAKQTSSASEELARLSSQLQELVGQFKV